MALNVLAQARENAKNAQSSNTNVLAQAREKANSNPLPSQGWMGIFGDVLKHLQEVPENTANMIGELPSEIGGLIKGVASPKKLLTNLALGPVEGAIGYANIPGNFSEYLKEKGIGDKDMPTFPKIPDLNLHERLGVGDEPGENLARSIGSFGLAGKLTGLGKASGVGGLAKTSALAAASQNEDPISGAALGIVPELGLRGLAKGKRKIGEKISNARENMREKPPMQVHPTYDKETILRNARQAEGTETPLGHIIGDASLNRHLENVLSKTEPHAAESLARTKNQVEQKGHDFLTQIGYHRAPHDINQHVTTLLQDEAEHYRLQSQEHYKKRNEIANEVKLKLPMKHTQEIVQEHRKFIEDDPILSLNPETKKVYNQLLDLSKPFEKVEETHIKPNGEIAFAKEPKKSSNFTAQGVQILSSALSKEGQRLLHNPVTAGRGQVYLKLASTLKKDLHQAISDSDSAPLIRAQREADENYRTTRVPFLEKGIYKYISGAKNGESIIDDLIKSKTKDKTADLRALMTVLPPQSRNMIALQHFQHAVTPEGHLDMTKLIARGENLGRKQQNLILHPEQASLLHDLIGIHKKNEKARNYMANQQTGIGLMDQVLKHKSSIKQLAATAGAGLMGVPGMALLAAALGHEHIYKPAQARKQTHFLTNEGERNKVVRQILEDENYTGQRREAFANPSHEDTRNLREITNRKNRAKETELREEGRREREQRAHERVQRNQKNPQHEKLKLLAKALSRKVVSPAALNEQKRKEKS